jgi:hypothetical protein
MVFVAQLSIWLQELYPQQHHDQFGKFLEMQPLPGLDAHGLGAEQEGLFTVCGSSRVGELELAPVLLGSALPSWYFWGRLLIQNVIAAHAYQGKGVLD